MTHDQTTPAPVEVRDTRLTRPIVGIKNRTAQEVFDIMCDRIAHSAPAGEVEPVAWMYTHGSTDHKIPYLTMERDERFAALADTIETPLYTHPAPPADLVELVGHWRFLAQMIEDRIVETDQPDRVMWHGVWYDGPLATAYLETLRAIQKLARAALAKHGGA